MYPVKQLHSEKQHVQRTGNQQELMILYDEIHAFRINVFKKSGDCSDLILLVGLVNNKIMEVCESTW